MQRNGIQVNECGWEKWRDFLPIELQQLKQALRLMNFETFLV